MTWRGAALARFIRPRDIPFNASATEECESGRRPRTVQRLASLERAPIFIRTAPTDIDSQKHNAG